MLWGGKNAYIRGEKKKINFEKKSWWQKKASIEFEKCLRHDSRELLRTIINHFMSLSFPARLSAQRYLSLTRTELIIYFSLLRPNHTLGRSTLTKDWRWEEFLKKNTGRIPRDSEKWWLLYRYLRRYCWKNFIYSLAGTGGATCYYDSSLIPACFEAFCCQKRLSILFFSMSELLQVQKC